MDTDRDTIPLLTPDPAGRRPDRPGCGPDDPFATGIGIATAADRVQAYGLMADVSAMVEVWDRFLLMGAFW